MHISFIRSSDYDEWTVEQAMRMIHGGNKKARYYFQSQGIALEGVSKYNTASAKAYKHELNHLASGKVCEERPVVSSKELKLIDNSQIIPINTTNSVKTNSTDLGNTLSHNKKSNQKGLGGIKAVKLDQPLKEAKEVNPSLLHKESETYKSNTSSFIYLNNANNQTGPNLLSQSLQSRYI